MSRTVGPHGRVREVGAGEVQNTEVVLRACRNRILTPLLREAREALQVREAGRVCFSTQFHVVFRVDT